MICLRLCNYNFLHVRPVKVAVIRPVEPALRRKHRFPRILIQIGRPPAETAVCKNVMLAAAHQQKFHIVVVSSSLQVNPGDIRILLVPILAKLPSGPFPVIGKKEKPASRISLPHLTDSFYIISVRTDPAVKVLVFGRQIVPPAHMQAYRTPVINFLQILSGRFSLPAVFAASFLFLSGFPGISALTAAHRPAFSRYADSLSVS